MSRDSQLRRDNDRRFKTAVIRCVVVAGLGCALAAAAQAAEGDPERAMLELDVSKFATLPTIDHKYWPLKPGTQFIYQGFTDEDGVRTPHRIETTVTDLTKIVSGVRVVVIHELDYVRDLMEEAELGFFAQDNEGNVWHLGEYTETYTEAGLVGGKIWIPGSPEGSLAGIMMPAELQVGAPSFSEGFAPAPINWSDRGRVTELGMQITVPAGGYDGVTVIEEFNEEEPGAFQLKYYAPNVGVVRIGWRGEDELQEEVALVEYNQLDADEMADIRKHALEMEGRGYVYGMTTPLEHRPPQ